MDTTEEIEIRWELVISAKDYNDYSIVYTYMHSVDVCNFQHSYFEWIHEDTQSSYMHLNCN